MWIRNPSTREGVPTHSSSGPCSSSTAAESFVLLAIPSGTDIISAWWTPEFHHWKDALVHLVAASSHLHLTSSHTDFDVSCLRRKWPWRPWRYDKSQHVTTSLKLSTFINMIHLKHPKKQTQWVQVQVWQCFSCLNDSFEVCQALLW